MTTENAINTDDLIDVSIAQNGGVKKRILKEAPEGALGPPPKGWDVTAHYTGTLASDGTKFDSSVDRGTPFKFTIGKGQVIKGWDEGFASMKVGEKALLIISPEYGYGANGSPPKIPGGAILHFEVELLGFEEKIKEKYQMTKDERLAMADKLKAEGTEFFQKSLFAEAAAKYEKAATYTVETDCQDEDDDDEMTVPEDERALFISCWSNSAMSLLKLNRWTEAIQSCNKVLALESEATTNTKALYRRGLARIHLGLFKEAKTDLMAAYALDKANKDVRKALALLKEQIASAKLKEKAAFGGLFDKPGGLYEDKKGPIAPGADNPHVFFDIKAGEDDMGR